MLKLKTLLAASLIAATASAAPLSMPERHRLAAYVSYIVAAYEDDAAPCCSTYKVGDTCPECRGAGEVGDGVVMMKCIWKSDDGQYYCKSGKVAQAGSVSEELWEKLEGVQSDACWNESTVRDLGCKLEDAINEGKQQEDCDRCQEQPEPEPGPPPQPEPEITDLKQTRWNWQGKGSVPTEEMRRHLREEHDLTAESVDKMSRGEMEALHNLLHNEELRAADPADSCPSGKCPTSAKSSGGGCPGGNCPTSRSRSSGFRLFRRR